MKRRLLAATALALACLMVSAAVVMNHGARHLHRAIEDAQRRGAMVGTLAVDVAVMQARMDLILDR